MGDGAGHQQRGGGPRAGRVGDLVRGAGRPGALRPTGTHSRHFGGYVYGVVDATDLGPADQHVFSLSLAGYGLRLDHSYVRQIYASASGSTVREITQNVLQLAGLDAVFTSHGVELDDVITRAVYPVQSVMTILRELADLHGAIVTVDEWLRD